MKKNKNNAVKARVSVEAKMRLQVDDQKEQSYNFNYEVIVTTERVEYFVQNIASVISKMASRIAEPSRKPTKVSKNGARSHKSTSENSARTTTPTPATAPATS